MHSAACNVKHGILLRSKCGWAFIPVRAAKLLGAAEALREKIDSPMTDYERVEYEQSVARLRSMLAEAEFNALWAEGRSMTMEQAIQLALSQ